MNARKLLSVFLAFLMLLLCFAACDGGGDAETSADASAETTGTPDGESDPSGGGSGELKLVENGASEYRIIIAERYADALETTAFEMVDRIAAATGAVLSATTDFEHPNIPNSEATDYEILVGTTRDGKYFETSELPELTDLDYHVTVVGSRVLILGGSVSAIMRGVAFFMETYLPTENTGNWTLPTSVDHLKISDRSGTITVMSFNLLHGGTSYANKYIYGTEDPVNERVHTLDQRRSRVRSVILSYMPDVIGMQEVSNWHNFLDSDSALCDAGYKLLRCQKNKKISIYYNTNTLTALETGSIWLTEDPENLQCSVEWNSDGNPRLAHYVRFQINATGETFVAVNTHIGFENATLQKNQTIVVGEYCQKLADQYDDPVVCTGDFNSAYSSVHYKAFMELGLMGDTRFLATESSTGTGSFHGFGSSNLAAYAIDQVMVSKKDWVVSTYQVDYTMFGTHVYYSDHYAVVATMILAPKD